MGIVQEKFQTEFTPPSGNHEWVSDKSARRSKSSPERFNRLPPGTDIENQSLTDQPGFPKSLAGATDVTHAAVNEQALRKGFSRLPMSPVEDAYTGEHTDVFYGEKTVDGESGFAERGNLMDRI